MKPIIALNFKSYKESLGERGLALCEIAAEVAMVSGVRVVVAPQPVDLREAVRVGTDVFAQHCDGNAQGAFTGSVTAESLKHAGAGGSLLNHSEHRMPAAEIAKAVERLRANGLESMVCAHDVHETAELAKLKPTFVAVEPPELIGKGVSVSTAKPEVVTGAVDLVKKSAPGVQVLCGAGVSNASDVKTAMHLGVKGVLLASAYVMAQEPKKLLEGMAAAMG